MQLESHATPPTESPQQRYASLHRAIDRGLDADEVWSELAEVCLALGQADEAMRCVRRIRGDAQRFALESKLARAGVAAAPVPAPVPAPEPRHPAAASTARGREPNPISHGTPDGTDDSHLADDRGASAAALGSGPATTGEWLGDAFSYLCQGHLPWLVLGVAASFPVMIGIGGVLTVGVSPWGTAALVAGPVLGAWLLGLALLRRILVDSAFGGTSPPVVGSLGGLLTDALRSVADVGLVVGLLLGPYAMALRVGAPVPSVVPGLLIGGFLLPMALVLRAIRGDLAALSPVTLLRGVQRTGAAYLGLLGILLGLAVPAGLLVWVVAQQTVWTRFAVLGPLLTVLAFFAARLLGTWCDAMRLELGGVLGRGAIGRRDDGAEFGSIAPQAAEAMAPEPDEAPELPTRPEGLAHYATPPASPRPRRSRQRVEPAAAPPAPRTIEGRAPRGKPADGPDLRHMPGAVVVSGAERERSGAAARRD